MFCLTCHERPAFCKQECQRCYSYGHWAGIPRPLKFTRSNRQNFMDLTRPCQDCHLRPRYAKGLCHSCYTYFNRTGHHRTTAPRPWKSSLSLYCVVCLQLFPSSPSACLRHCCSYTCASILRKIMHYKPQRCQKCQRLRPIAAKQLCRPCYVYTRYVLTKGYTREFPRCPVSHPYKQAIGITYGSS